MAVRAPLKAEVPLLQAIGVAAGRRFAEVGLDAVAEDEPHDQSALERWRAAGRAWVTTDRDGHPVGFVVVDVVDGTVHIEEISVLPEHNGRGHGMALMRHVETWARGKGFPSVTLTTFSEVPWNRPWYERRGYRVLEEPEWTPGLAQRRAEEAEAGLDPELRVIMAKAL
ncbi:MAG TPA: GNAT family N-acetyltransferase [Acidimicrobiales bacterium]